MILKGIKNIKENIHDPDLILKKNIKNIIEIIEILNKEEIKVKVNKDKEEIEVEVNIDKKSKNKKLYLRR